MTLFAKFNIYISTDCILREYNSLLSFFSQKSKKKMDNLYWSSLDICVVW